MEKLGPAIIGYTAPELRSVAIIKSNTAKEVVFTADMVSNKTNEYATSHVLSKTDVDRETLEAIKQTDALRRLAGEEPLTQKEKQLLIAAEWDKARAHEDADRTVMTAERELEDAQYPGPDYASEETITRARQNAQDQLQRARAVEIATDKAMLPSLRGH